jgi:hypothetical protein
MRILFMKRLGTFFGIIFGLALLAAFAAGAYFLFQYVVGLFDLLDPQFQAITLIASVVALFCALIIADGLKGRQYKAANLHMVTEKANLYERVLMYWCDPSKQPISSGELINESELVRLERQLVLHASPKVLTAYLNLRRQGLQENASDTQTIDLLSKLALEMRSDLGHLDPKLKENELLDLLLGRR